MQIKNFATSQYNKKKKKKKFLYFTLILLNGLLLSILCFTLYTRQHKIMTNFVRSRTIWKSNEHIII